MQLVRLTLQGMASRNADEGVKAMGRHAATIRLGRSLWESPALPAEVQRHIQERFFDDGSLPPINQVKSAVAFCEKSIGRAPSALPM